MWLRKLLPLFGLRVFGFLLGLGFFAFPVAPAQAAVYDYPDQGMAYMACMAGAKAYYDQYRNQYNLTGYFCLKNTRDYLECATTTSSSCSFYRHNHRWPSGATCSTRSPASGGLHIVGTGGTSCLDGCEFGIGGSGLAVQLGDKTYGSLDGANPTGAVCAGEAPSTVTDSTCEQIGDLTQCVKPDGRHCAVASTGKEFCWSPTEAGVKTHGNDGATKAPANLSVNAPRSDPPNGGDWEPKASGSMQVNSGGQLTQYTIQLWQSSYGSDGNGTPDGTGGEGEGDGGPNASGGATCDVASFSCSDMASVECNQLVQTYYLRCKGVDLTGGDTCDSPPVCKGNAADCYISSTLWRMRCEGIGDGDGSSDAVGNGAAEIVSGEGDGSEEPDMSGLSEGPAQEAEGIWFERSASALADQLGDLDDSGFINSRSCPPSGSFSVGGSSFELSYGPICSLLEQASVLVMALAYWLAFRIITKPQWS